MIRTYARVEGEMTPASFIETVAQGRSYASMGPLFFTKGIHFGDTVKLKAGETLSLKMDAFAVHGLDRVEVYTHGTEIGSPMDVRSLGGSKNREALAFELKPTESTWFNFIAKDAAGKVAVSNPIWVHVER